MQPYFDLFGLQLPAYGLMMLAGICLGAGLVMLRRKRFALARDDTFHLAILAIVGAVAGAKLLYVLAKLPVVIQNLDIYSKHPEALLGELAGGLVFYGGVIGAFLVCGWYMRRYKVPLWPVLDLFAPAVPLAHAMGRVGCFLAGCCYGAPADWGFVYTHAIAHEANGLPRIPVQLFETAGNLILCLIILIYQRKPRRRGRSFALYLLLYAPLRFILEFFRGDEVRGSVWMLSTSQWLSFAFLAVGLYLWLRQDKNKSKSNDVPGKIEMSTPQAHESGPVEG